MYLLLCVFFISAKFYKMFNEENMQKLYSITYVNATEEETTMFNVIYTDRMEEE